MQGRGAALAHLRDTGNDRGGVPQSVLGIERDRRKAFTRDELGDDRRRQPAPAAVHDLAGLEAAGEREGCFGCHGERVLCCDRPWQAMSRRS